MSDDYSEVTRGELFGFLKASISTLSEDMREIKECMKTIRLEQASIRQDVETYKTTVRVSKFFVGGLIGLMSLLNFNTLKAIFYNLLGK